MRIYPEQLPQQLHKKLLPLYLLLGNEPLFQLESHDKIQHIATDRGFLERHRFTLDNNVNWEDVFHCQQAFSLFSNQQILDLEIPESGLNAANANQLRTLIEQQTADILIIIQGPRITKAQEKAKWFQTACASGAYVPCNTPDSQQLPTFIQNRCRQLNLHPDQESILLLAQWHEGNLLALAQSLEKLRLLFPEGELTLPRLQETLNRNSHYTPFQWIDSLLAGKANRCQRILHQLESEGVEIIILLRTLQRELTQLYKLQEQLKNGQSLQQLFYTHRVWQTRQTLYQSALSRLTLIAIIQLLHQLTRLELSVKTEYQQTAWASLSALCADACGASPHLTPISF